jgi:hypothetical protein
MAKKKKEEPIVDSETGSLKVKEKVEKQPDGNETKGDVTKVKEKMNMKPTVIEQTVTKVDLNKPLEEKPVEGVETETQEVEKQDTPVVEEITNETIEQVEEVANVAAEAIKDSMENGEPLPENIQKLVNFMDETGGDLNDYVKLNKDYSEMDNQDILYEHYKQTKPHLNAEEINFLLEDQFSYDEDIDDDKEIKRKKLALKEHVAQARQHLDSEKSKYYEEIKAGSKLTTEQQNAIDYFNKHSKEAEQTRSYEEKAKANFLNKTNKFFGDQFKGFEFETGEKKFRFNVNDVNKVKDTQSDINNFIGKFLDNNGQMSDEAGYHKALYAAMNPDAVAKHFYEQGKADALKTSINESKNIDMKPRQELNNNFDSGGYRARVIGESTADFKFKIKNKK